MNDRFVVDWCRLLFSCASLVPQLNDCSVCVLFNMALFAGTLGRKKKQMLVICDFICII